MPADKLSHLLAGSTVTALAYPFGFIAVCVAVFGAAIGKEAFDATGRGYVDVATVAGGAVLVVWYAVQPVMA